MRRLICLLALGPMLACSVAVAAALPDPLTLKAALALADAPHPDLKAAAADVASARAGVEAAQATTGLNVGLEGRLRWVDPPALSPIQSHDDNMASLYVRKDLYDFGRSHASEAAAKAELDSRRLTYLNVRARRRIEIMRRFFQVLLADQAASRDNEAMAVTYVSLNKLRNRHDLGDVSNLDVLKLTSEYQKSRIKYIAAEARQRATRSSLAIVLGRPDDLPSDLSPPALPSLKRKIPTYGGLLKQVLADNPHLRALQAAVTSAQEEVAAADAGHRPVLSGEMEGAYYSRKMGSNDRWRAGVVLHIPLYSGGTVDSAVARREAALSKAQARLDQARLDLRQRVLELWQELHLLSAQKAEVRAREDYRELYLDNSRALYQMELTTDLGDAMVRLSEVQLAAQRHDYRTALVWAKLDALRGRLPGAAGRGGDDDAQR